MAYLTAILTTALTSGTVTGHTMIVNKKVSRMLLEGRLTIHNNDYSTHTSNLALKIKCCVLIIPIRENT